MKRSQQAGAIGAAAAGTGAAMTAGFASACCVGPAVAPILMTVLGSSGLIAISYLRPYTPWMLAASALMLAFSFRQSYRRTACEPDGAVAPIPRGVRIARVITWIAAIAWVASAAYAVYGLLNE